MTPPTPSPTGGAPAGSLVIVATPIGNLGDLSPRAVEALAGADLIACEDTRRTRKLLSHAGITGVRLLAVHGENERAQVPALVERMQRGERVALVSDAGTPGISDPGERLVKACVDVRVPVHVVPGPSAVIAALVVSGLPAARFAFEGFLPRKGGERARRLKALAADDRTTVIYESPHRVAQTLVDLAGACGPGRRVSIARELTKRFEEVWRGSLADAVEATAGREPLGEHVIVVAPAPLAALPTDGEIEAALQAEIDAGADRKSAVAAVATELGVPKRLVYDASLKL